MPVHLYGQPADMPALRGDRRAARPRARRGCVPGAPGDVGRPAGRHVRRGRRVQLLPDEESRRARRRRRDRDQRRRRLADKAQAAAQRRPDRPVSPRRVRREQPARRDAGGDSARASAVAPGWTARRRALAARYRAALAGGAGGRAARMRSGHVYHLFPVRRARPRGFQAHLDVARHRHARPLSRCRIPRQPAFAGSRRPRVRSPTACAPKSARCRCTRALDATPTPMWSPRPCTSGAAPVESLMSGVQ